MVVERPHGAREVSVLYSVRDGYQVEWVQEAQAALRRVAVL
jgi:hypothetical protein